MLLDLLKGSVSMVHYYFLLAAKWVLLAVFVSNFRSWPFAWLLRVFLPVVHVGIRFYLFELRNIFRPAKVRKIKRRQWLERLSPIGRNPFNSVTSYSSWAGFDDCDYNFHLSNSSYAKTLDMARMKAALEHFPSYIRSGGHMVLGATHFTYIREIRMLATYEARVSIASWDNKWLYLVVRFVTLPKSTSKKAKDKKATLITTPTTDSPPISDMHTPANATSTTPLPSKAPSVVEALQTLAQRKEPDGAILHCVSINEFVIKQGRITVPPALALACDGYCTPPPDGAGKPYSAATPPPHWVHVRKILENGGMKAMRDFLRGGWKDVPEGERWWEQALGGSVEAERVKNLALIEGVRKGMEGARAIVDVE